MSYGKRWCDNAFFQQIQDKSKLWQGLIIILIITAIGLTGLQTLEEEIDAFMLDNDKKKFKMKKDMVKSKIYLKARYSIRYLENRNIAKHCMFFKLIDSSNNNNFQPELDYEHNEMCEDVLIYFSLLKNFEAHASNLANKEEKA